MIKVNLKDGKTLSYDLQDEKAVKEWEELSSHQDFQQRITGIGIIYNAQWYTLPLPKKFRQVFFQFELVENNKKDAPEDRKYVGERVKCYADDTLISLLVYYGSRPKMSRVDVIKLGKRRFNPAIKEIAHGTN